MHDRKKLKLSSDLSVQSNSKASDSSMINLWQLLLLDIVAKILYEFAGIRSWFGNKQLYTQFKLYVRKGLFNHNFVTYRIRCTPGVQLIRNYYVVFDKEIINLQALVTDPQYHRVRKDSAKSIMPFSFFSRMLKLTELDRHVVTYLYELTNADHNKSSTELFMFDAKHNPHLTANTAIFNVSKVDIAYNDKIYIAGERVYMIGYSRFIKSFKCNNIPVMDSIVLALINSDQVYKELEYYTKRYTKFRLLSSKWDRLKNHDPADQNRQDAANKLAFALAVKPGYPEVVVAMMNTARQNIKDMIRFFCEVKNRKGIVVMPAEVRLKSKEAANILHLMTRCINENKDVFKGTAHSVCTTDFCITQIKKIRDTLWKVENDTRNWGNWGNRQKDSNVVVVDSINMAAIKEQQRAKDNVVKVTLPKLEEDKEDTEEDEDTDEERN